MQPSVAPRLSTGVRYQRYHKQPQALAAHLSHDSRALETSHLQDVQPFPPQCTLPRARDLLLFAAPPPPACGKRRCKQRSKQKSPIYFCQEPLHPIWRPHTSRECHRSPSKPRAQPSAFPDGSDPSSRRRRRDAAAQGRRAPSSPRLPRHDSRHPAPRARTERCEALYAPRRIRQSGVNAQAGEGEQVMVAMLLKVLKQQRKNKKSL